MSISIYIYIWYNTYYFPKILKINKVQKHLTYSYSRTFSHILTLSASQHIDSHANRHNNHNHNQNLPYMFLTKRIFLHHRSLTYNIPYIHFSLFNQQYYVFSRFSSLPMILSINFVILSLCSMTLWVRVCLIIFGGCLLDQCGL